MHQAYKTFLTTLADSKTGQTYESLQWAGEGLLTLDAYAEAEKVFRRVLDRIHPGPPVSPAAERPRQVDDRPELRLVSRVAGPGEVRRGQLHLLDELLAQKPPYIETLFEKGMLLEAEAEAGQGQLGGGPRALGGLDTEAGADRARGRRRYYDAWYHVAWVLSSRKNTAKARQALLGVMRLSPERRRPRNEGEIPGSDRAAQMK